MVNKKMVILLFLLIIISSAGASALYEASPDCIDSGKKTITIAESGICSEMGTLSKSAVYNENTKTWWIDLDVKEEYKNDMCNPVCVVFESDSHSEINWRCRGILPPE